MSESWALARYQAIAAYVALVPQRGERKILLEKLAARSWPSPDGSFFVASAETLRVWVRRYRNGGIAALQDKVPQKPGIHALNAKEIALFCDLKREVPARSLDRLIRIAEDLKLIEAGKASRSTVHRALRSENLSARRHPDIKNDDLDRYEVLQTGPLSQRNLAVRYAGGADASGSRPPGEKQACLALHLPG